MNNANNDLPDEYEVNLNESPHVHLRAVLADEAEPADVVFHEGDVALIRLNSDRNLWGVTVDHDGVETINGDKIFSTRTLAKYLEQYVNGEQDSADHENNHRLDPYGDGYA